MALESTNQHWHYSSSGLEDVWRKDNISNISMILLRSGKTKFDGSNVTEACRGSNNMYYVLNKIMSERED
jgi:hypothetical protein